MFEFVAADRLASACRSKFLFRCTQAAGRIAATSVVSGALTLSLCAGVLLGGATAATAETLNEALVRAYRENPC
jgi:hypothetical protein